MSVLADSGIGPRRHGKDSLTGGFGATKPLTKKAERKLIVKAKAGDRDAQARLITAMLRLVRRDARKWAKTPEDMDELVQEGCAAILRAIELFDLDREVRFSTYASQWWYQAIRRRAHAQNSRGLTPQFRGKPQVVMPLDAPGGADGEDFMSLLVGNEPRPDDVAFESEQRDRIAGVVDRLPERLRNIVRWRYLSPRTITLDQIGKVYGFSRERARQLEVVALARVKVALQRMEVE